MESMLLKAPDGAPFFPVTAALQPPPQTEAQNLMALSHAFSGGLCDTPVEVSLFLSDVASNHAEVLHLLKGRVNHKPMLSLLISALAPDMLAQSWPPCHTESAWPLADMRVVQLVDACEPDDCAQSDRHAATRFAETPISIGLSRACRAMFALGGSWRVACCAGLPCDGDDWFESGRGIHDASRLLKNA